LKDFTGKVILVTGGAGFIGHHLVQHIISYQPQKLIVVDDLSTGFKENIKHLITAGQITFIEAKVQDLIISILPSKIDYIFHLAAIVSVPFSIEQPFRSHQVNESSLLNMLEIANKVQTKKVIFASSSAVYGDPIKVPVSEVDNLNPKSPYAYSKYINELHAQSFAQAVGLDFLSFRFFNVYGPGQRADSPYSGVITLFLDKLKNNKTVSIFGDGTQLRDFVHVNDVINALVDGALSNYKNCVYNVGTGQSTSINGLYTVIQKIVDSHQKPIYKEERSGDIKNSVADIKKIREELYFDPKVPLVEGIRMLVSSEEGSL
jgi:nucleoside-diphosphate-sugar epimerase